MVFMLAAIVVMAALEFIHSSDNPRAETGKGIDARLLAADLPARAGHVSIANCAHRDSSESRWPLYAAIAPGRRLIEWDIVEARRLMDLSRWDDPPAEIGDSLVARTIMDVNNEKIQPLQYLTLNFGAWSSPPEVQALATMIDTSDEKSLAGPGDPARGKLVFEKRCSSCHSMTKNQQGPQLAGVLGRKAGSVARFQYSSALKKSGLTWTEVTLDKWLTDPDTLVPETAMEYRVRDAEERRDLIAYMMR